MLPLNNKKEQTSMKLPHVALALLINVIWGYAFVAAKIGIDHFPPLFFTALRFLLVAAVLFYFLKPVKGKMLELLLVAVTVGTLHFSFMYYGIFLTGGVSAVAITIQLIAPFSVILAVVFLKEHIGWRRTAGIALAFGGVMVLGFDPVVFDHLSGVALVAMGALVMAVGMILMRRLQGVTPMQLQAWISAFSVPPLLVLSFAFEEGQMEGLRTIDWEVIWALAFTVVMTTIIAHGSWFYLLQRYSVTTLTPYGLLAPIFGVGFGVFLYSEPLTLRFFLGSLITMTGVAIINFRSVRKLAAEKP